VVAAARLFTKIFPAADISLHPGVWQESFLSLPDDAPKELVNIFTGETIKSLPHGQSKSLDLANLFQNLPVALLFGRTD
jgi:maltooligosyltrehalose synthase